MIQLPRSVTRRRSAEGYVNPRQIRDFARATGRLAKADALDAQIIALFAERIRPEPRPIADAESQMLVELVARRRQVVEMIGMEANRLRQARSPRVRRTIEATRKPWRLNWSSWTRTSTTACVAPPSGELPTTC